MSDALSSTSAAPAAPAPGWFASLRLAAADIKIAHSVFALPFAILAAFLASPVFRADEPTDLELRSGLDRTWRTFLAQLAIVVACMIFARTWAMLVNRLADRAFDAENQRTATRLIASGALPLARARAITAAAGIGFVTATALFLLYKNPWPILLSVPVLAWIALYSYTKRFTWLCHIFLGGALAASPLAAAIAIRPGALADTPSLWYLSGFVLLWVAGFDVLYAIQDIDFDRSRGLSSIPAKVGLRSALHASRALHAVAFVGLALAVQTEPRFGVATHVSVAAVAALLVTEHVVVARRGVRGIPMAFFTLNGIVSCLLGAAGIVDIVR
jgi:4-hydroxybenzoate polyprenyltransferase